MKKEKYFNDKKREKKDKMYNKNNTMSHKQCDRNCCNLIDIKKKTMNTKKETAKKIIKIIKKLQKGSYKIYEKIMKKEK